MAHVTINLRAAGYLLPFLIVCASLPACGPTIEITGSWKNPQATTRKVNSILVTALTDKTNVRQTVEADMVNTLKKRGYKAMMSIDIMPPSFTSGKEPDKEALLSKIKGKNIDAILTVALIDKETENRYVPGNYGYQPVTRYNYYGLFGGYYTTWYPTLYSPGYYTEEKTYFLETNLYDSKTEALLWSAQSETYNPDGLSGFSKEFSTVMLNRMEKDAVIKK